jgi:hypothetical protein
LQHIDFSLPHKHKHGLDGVAGAAPLNTMARREAKCAAETARTPPSAPLGNAVRRPRRVVAPHAAAVRRTFAEKFNELKRCPLTKR